MISVVIPCCNEEYCEYTVRSVLGNTSGRVEVIVVDDNCKMTHAFPEGVVHLRTPGPYHGVDVARHMGIMHARHEIVVIMDAHMSVQPDWDGELLKHFRPKTDVACVSCRHDPDHWQEPTEWGYCGAYMVPTMSDSGYYGNSILQPKWASSAGPKIQAGERADVPCVLGAFYVFTRANYCKMGSPWQYLRIWGWSEQALSLAAWAVGLDTVCLPVKTGHMYRRLGPRNFVIPAWSTIYNQHLLAESLPMSDRFRSDLIAHLGKDRDCRRYASGDYAMADLHRKEELPSPLKKSLANGRLIDEYFEHWKDFR